MLLIPWLLYDVYSGSNLSLIHMCLPLFSFMQLQKVPLCFIFESTILFQHSVRNCSVIVHHIADICIRSKLCNRFRSLKIILYLSYKQTINYFENWLSSNIQLWEPPFNICLYLRTCIVIPSWPERSLSLLIPKVGVKNLLIQKQEKRKQNWIGSDKLWESCGGRKPHVNCNTFWEGTCPN